jgi:hypothetical protein
MTLSVGTASANAKLRINMKRSALTSMREKRKPLRGGEEKRSAWTRSRSNRKITHMQARGPPKKTPVRAQISNMHCGLVNATFVERTDECHLASPDTGNRL